MRRKQLYAILLAGTLAAGGAPVSAMAADTATETESGSEAGDLGAGENTDASQEEAPTEAPAEQPTEAPAERPADEASAEQPTEAPAQEAEPTETTADAAAEQTDTGISINNTDGTPTYYATLQEAVNAVEAATSESDSTVIRISKSIELDATVDVSGKNVCIYAAEDVSITRKDGFKGDMFKVSGENSALLFNDDGAKTLTVSGKLADAAQTAEGSIVSVSDKASFGLAANVTLTENTTSADGAAINCKGGQIALAGGTITGNTGAKGAVYSDSDISVQGTVNVKDNKIEDAQANVYLDQSAKFVVSDDMSNSAVSFTHGAAQDGLMVIEGAATVDFESAVKQFSYDTEDYTLNADTSAKTASLKKADTPTVSPEPSAAPSQGPTATPTKAPTATPTPTKEPSFLTYKSGTLKWESHSTVSLKMSVTKDCKWYYFYVDSGTSTSAIQNMYDVSRATNSAKANTEFTVKAENVPEADTWLVVCAKPTSGKAQMRVFKLDSASFKKKRPAAPGTSTRAARTHKVSESTVSGLENPLKFTPGTFYEFTVTGAGQNDKSPYVSGDERWIPMYWSTAENPTSSQKNTTFRIGSAKGIKEAKTYNMYIFFKKQIYNGSDWQDTDVIESISTQFSSQELTDADLTITPTGSADGGNGSGNGSGSSTDAELTATEAATEKANGSSSKSAVSTMDESPIGTMVALAALSLLAGGYILIRKRKKDI